MRKPPARPPSPAARPRSTPRPERPSGEILPWLWGRHAVLAALENPARKCLRLVATPEEAEEIAKRLPDCPKAQRLPREEITRLLPPGAVHQGLALLAKPLPNIDIETIIDSAANLTSAAILVLDQVTDPHNVGAVMRSAAAFGALAVVVPDRHAPEVLGTLAKAASGALEHVPLVRVVNLARTLEQLKKAGFWTVGLDGGAEKTLASHDLSGKVCLVLGAEGDGLRRLTREGCDLMARLPTSGAVASLNVSNASAIALYELARLR